MDDAALMRMMDGGAHLSHDFQPLAYGQLPRSGVDEQRFTADQLHGEIGLRPASAVGGAGLIDLCDTGVLQAAERERLEFETPEQLRAGETRFDHLQRDSATGVFLSGFVDGAHGAFPEQPVNPVRTDGGWERS